MAEEFTWNPQDLRDGLTTTLAEFATLRDTVLALDADYVDAAGQVVEAEAAEQRAVATYVGAEMVRITATFSDPTALAAIRRMLMEEAYTQPDVLTAAQATNSARKMLAVQEHRLKLLGLLTELVAARFVAEKKGA